MELKLKRAVELHSRGDPHQAAARLTIRTVLCRSLCAAWALLAAIGGTGHATESRTAAPLPGLKSDEDGKVTAESCLVTLSGENLRVELSVHADSTQAALLIEGSWFGWQGGSDAYPDRHFPELEIRIDGAPVTPEDRFEAYVGKTDITGLIRDSGMDPWAIAHDPPVTPVRAESRALKPLEHLGAVRRSGEQYFANWTARRMLRIPLETAPHQRIALAYLARPTYSQLSSDQLITSARQSEYCVSAKQLTSNLHLGSHPRFLHVTEYLIATGIDGHSPPLVTLAISMDPRRAAGSRTFHFACAPQGKPIAVAGNLTEHPVGVDQSGNLHVLAVGDP